MEFSRYLAVLETDAARLADAAAKGLDAGVPACPGWTVRDVVTHTAVVYLHKVECIRRQAAPTDWPPDVSGREPLELFREAFATLLEELRGRGPAAPSHTWYPPDQTVGFWYRRMAQETAIHRVDAESGHAMVTPVDPELATDGVDEVLILMLAGDWSDEPVDEAAGAVIDLATGGRSWQVGLDRTVVTCTPGVPAGESVAEADLRVAGDPSDLLLWAWGRAPADRLTVEGDPETLAALRRRLAMATQ